MWRCTQHQCVHCRACYRRCGRYRDIPRGNDIVICQHKSHGASIVSWPRVSNEFLSKPDIKLILTRGFTFGIGNVVGPVVGGAFADSKATWRWGFYVNLCIIGLLSPVYLFLIPSFKPQQSRSILSRLRDLDGAGTVLSIGSLVCLVMAINFGGTLYSWNSAQIIVFFIFAVLVLLLFAVQQYFAFLTKEASRLFPVVFLRDKEALLLFILTATFNSAGFIPIYYIPTYFQFTRGDSPLQSAVRLLPLIAFITFLILVNGGYLSKGGYYMPWFLVGSVLTLVAGVLFCKSLSPFDPVDSNSSSPHRRHHLCRCNIWI